MYLDDFQKASLPHTPCPPAIVPEKSAAETSPAAGLQPKLLKSALMNTQRVRSTSNGVGAHSTAPDLSTLAANCRHLSN